MQSKVSPEAGRGGSGKQKRRGRGGCGGRAWSNVTASQAGKAGGQEEPGGARPGPALGPLRGARPHRHLHCSPVTLTSDFWTLREYVSDVLSCQICGKLLKKKKRHKKQVEIWKFYVHSDRSPNPHAFHEALLLLLTATRELVTNARRQARRHSQNWRFNRTRPA